MNRFRSNGNPSSDLTSAITPAHRRIEHGNSADEYRVAHDALKDDSELWQMLAFAGLQHDGNGGLIEFRHCPSCQSTVARPIAQSDARFLCEAQAEIAWRSKQALSDASRSAGNSDVFLSPSSDNRASHE